MGKLMGAYQATLRPTGVTTLHPNSLTNLQFSDQFFGRLFKKTFQDITLMSFFQSIVKYNKFIE